MMAPPADVPVGCAARQRRQRPSRGNNAIGISNLHVPAISGAQRRIGRMAAFILNLFRLFARRLLRANAVCRFLLRSRLQGWPTERESTDEHITEAPNARRGVIAAARDTAGHGAGAVPCRASGAADADRHRAAAGAGEPATRPAKEEGGPETREEGGAEGQKGEEGRQEADWQGRQPQERERQGQGQNGEAGHPQGSKKAFRASPLAG
jgi:hypothetical protein